MTRPTPAPLAAVLAGNPLAGECLVLRARDGTLAGFTSLVRTQSVDLSGDGRPGPVACTGGMVLSAITLAAGLDASFAEVHGPVGPVLTQDAIDGGRWTDAEAWLVRVSPGAAGYAPIMAGKVRESRVEGARFVLEVRNQADALNQGLGVEMTAYCRATLGDARCGFALVPVLATVTAATDALRFEVSVTGTFVDGHFNKGKAVFTSGTLDGVVSENLFSWQSLGAGAGAIILWEPLSEAPQIGDTLNLFIGCGKTRAECVRIQGTALTMRGFPDAPGTEQLLKYPNAGGGE